MGPTRKVSSPLLQSSGEGPATTYLGCDERRAGLQLWEAGLCWLGCQGLTDTGPLCLPTAWYIVLVGNGPQ